MSDESRKTLQTSLEVFDDQGRVTLAAVLTEGLVKMDGVYLRELLLLKLQEITLRTQAAKDGVQLPETMQELLQSLGLQLESPPAPVA